MSADVDTQADDLARAFHEAYERLAPGFGYETRRESAVPWEDVPERNRALMRAVVREVVLDRAETAEDHLRACEAANRHLRAEVERLAEALREIIGLDEDGTASGQGPEYFAGLAMCAFTARAALAAVAPTEEPPS